MTTLADSAPSFRQRLAARGLDTVTALVIPSVLLMLALFVYPFFYGLVLSFHPKDGTTLGNYTHFFSDPFFRKTILTTWASPCR